MQPREKLLCFGPGSLDDSELLSILLGTGNKHENVHKLSARILSESEGFDGLSKVDSFSLQKIKGLGKAKSCLIVAAMEMSRRCLKQARSTTAITTPELAADYLGNEIGHHNQEHIAALYLDSRKQILRMHTLNIGTSTQSITDPKTIFAPAINCGADTLIIAHNHPSGNLSPSIADLNLTKAIAQAGTILQIPLMDHLIVAAGSWKSLRSSHRELFVAVQ